ncbi:transposase [Parachlamydia acanthamoebae]
MAEIKRLFEMDYAKSSRPFVHSKRELLNAILYILRTGCAWRDFPD